MSTKGEHSGTKKLQPPKPKISLTDLMFLISVNDIGLVKPSYALKLGSNDRFYIQIDFLSHLSKPDMNDVKITCDVVKMKASGKSVRIFEARRSLDKNHGWLINDLRAPQGLTRSGLVADVKVSFNGDLLDKISLEFCTERDKKYYSLDDTLRYIQCFFP